MVALGRGKEKMNNKKKTLTSLAAASMVITQAGQMSVFAKGATLDPEDDFNKSQVETDIVKTEKTQKELLEEQIREAQEKVDGAQSKLDEATPSMKDATNQLNTVKTNHKKASDNFKAANDAAYSYISNEISVNKNAIEQAKAELDVLKAEKERLEKESSNSEAQKAQLEKDYQDAQNKYNELISQGTVEGLTEQIVSQQKVVESANVSLQEAQAKYDAVKGQFDEATNKINDLEVQITTQQGKVDALNAQLSANETAMQEASVALNNVQQAYDAATDEEAKAELESQLATAQTNLTAATEAYNAANAELVNENGVLSSLQGNLESVKNENQAAINAYNEAQSVLTQAQQDKGAADTQLANLQQSLETTKASIIQAEKDVAAKKDLLDAAKKSTEELSKLVASTKAAYDAVQAQWNQGSLAFYESIGDAQAVDVIKEGITLGTTTLGDIGDSTDLTNMKKSLPMLAECNRLRKVNGLPELKTSGLMMAISQVKVNHTVHKADGGSPHTGLYNTGENLANGFTWGILAPEDGEMQDASESGPFVGWYNWEKKFLNDFYVEHPEEKEKTIDETLLKYPDLFYRVGHYLNILSAYDVTGVSYVPYDKNNLADTSGNFAQQFASNTDFFDSHGMGLDSAINKDKQYDNRVGQMTVTEFTEKFGEYYDSLKADLETKQTAYNTAKKALDDAQNNGNAIANATKAYEEALAKLEKLRAFQSTTEGQIQNAEKAVAAATEKVADAQANVVKAEAVKNEKAEAVKTAQAKADTQKKVVDAKAQKVADAKVEVGKAEDAIKTVQDTIKKSEQSVATLKVQLDAAKAEMDGKTKTYEETRNQVKESKDKLTNLNTTKADKETERAGLAEEVTQTRTAKETAEKELKDATAKLDGLKESKKNREDLKVTMDGFSKKLEEVKKVLSENAEALKKNAVEDEKVSGNFTQLKDEQARLDGVLAYYHSLVDGIMAMVSDGVDLTAEEEELLSKLQVAIENLEDARAALNEAQANYDTEKAKYDVLAKDVENAKAELAKAEAALDAYLNPAPVTKPESKPENKPSGTKTNTTMNSKVNTAAETALGFYALSGVLGLAGVAFTGKHARKED